MFVRVANKYRANIWVEKDSQRVNGKSILGLLMLAAAKGTKLLISGEGDDAERAVRELELLIQSRFNQK
jgi:phosphocarrier protein